VWGDFVATSPAQFIEEVPTYVVRDGRMHISIGHCELVMPVHVCRQAMARCNRALDDWFASQQPQVVPIKAPRRH
jgi:hypothetical protein